MARAPRSGLGRLLFRGAAIAVLVGLVAAGALAFRGGVLARFGVRTVPSTLTATARLVVASPMSLPSPAAAAPGDRVTPVALVNSPTFVPTSSPTTVKANSSTPPADLLGVAAGTRPPAGTPSPTSSPLPTSTAGPSLLPLNPTPTPPLALTSIVSANVLVSDSFNRANADRCALGPADLALGGRGAHYYLPIFPSGNLATNPVGANIVANAVQNNGQDYGGIQLTSSSAGCSAVGGENIGQDLNIRVDLLVSSDASGHITQAGPYFRSRAATPGDGIIGGASAGYWVQLHSTGEVTVKRLNPQAFIASSAPRDLFDDRVFHNLEMAVQGSNLQVALDGQPLTLIQDGNRVTTVSISATAGSNDGAAGIAFGAETNRGQIGGQRAKNLLITGFHWLASP